MKNSCRSGARNCPGNRDSSMSVSISVIDRPKSADTRRSPFGVVITLALILPAVSLQAAEADARFKRLDKNNDGKISREELRAPLYFIRAATVSKIRVS